jgi:hypothetical protein
MERIAEVSLSNIVLVRHHMHDYMENMHLEQWKQSTLDSHQIAI